MKSKQIKIPSFADKQVILSEDPSSNGPMTDPTFDPFSFKMTGSLGGTENWKGKFNFNF